METFLDRLKVFSLRSLSVSVMPGAAARKEVEGAGAAHDPDQPGHCDGSGGYGLRLL